MGTIDGQVGGAGGQVGVVQEAAGEAVIAPVVAVLLHPAQLLAGAGCLLVTGQGDGHDHIVLARLALRHREKGALGPGQGHQGEETQERKQHGHQVIGATRKHARLDTK